MSKSISTNEELGAVSLEADYLFGRCIPHLDRDGRITGNPELLRSIVAPLRELDTERCLSELADKRLVEWYERDGKQVLAFPNFRKHQRGMKYEREAESRYPAMDSTTPDLVRTRSGPSPDLVPPKLSEVKRSEVKLREGGVTGPDPETLDRIKALFADRGEGMDLVGHSTSIPKDDVDQHSEAVKFLAPYFPETRPGAGLNPAIRNWIGRIPAHRLIAAIRELQAIVIPATNGKSEQRWRDLNNESQKKLILGTLNPMLKEGR